MTEPPAENERLVRDRATRAVSSRDLLLLVSPTGTAIELASDSADLASAVIDFLAVPHSRTDVVDFVASLTDQPFDAGVIDDLLSMLQETGIVSTLGAQSRQPSPMSPAPRTERGSRGKIALAVTGAIAAVEAPRMTMLLLQLGFEVWAVTTESATRFVSVEALTAITHRPTFSSSWSGDPNHPVPHIEIAEWADLVLVYPASATTLSRLATGDCSDVVSALAIATRAPVVLAPSMNSAMLEAPSVERNLETLRDDGFFVVLPSFGIEVADRPESRRERLGPALTAERVAELVGVLFDRLTETADRSPKTSAPFDWDRVYAEPTRQSWETDALDADIRSALAQSRPPATVVDLGTGLGTAAIEMAKLGYHVTATDLSSLALERAALRADGLPIVFVRDDVTRSSLHVRFDVAVDRGLFHVLESHQIEQYAATLRRLVRVGGRLLLKLDSSEAPAERKTLRVAPSSLAALLPGFELRSHERSAIGRGEADTAWLCILERVAPRGA